MKNSHGVSVPRVKDRYGKSFGLDALDEIPWPFTKPLSCEACGTPVKAVSGCTRRRGRGISEVKAHYALINRTTGDHREGCRFAFDRRADELHRINAHAIEKAGSNYTLLLNERNRGAPSPRDSSAKMKTTQRLSFKAPRNWKPLPKTIQVARDIVRLLREFDNDPMALKFFTARWQGESIPWVRFCFDLEQPLGPLLLIAHDEKSRHPVAAHGRVIHGPRPSNNGKSWFLPLHTGGTGTAVTAALRSCNKSILDFEAGAEVLAYGQWGQFETHTRGGKKLEVRLWCHFSHSVTRL